MCVLFVWSNYLLNKTITGISMDIAITGHASGIGKGVFEFYANNCIGFDLTNGYNIETDIDKILEESRHCKVFINNAYCKNKQTDLANAWHKMHVNDDFLLINVSSTFVELTIDVQIEINSPCLMEYIKYKKKLNQTSDLINQSGDKCKSMALIIGLVDTQFINSWHARFNQYELEYFTKFIAESNLLKIADIVDIIDFVIHYHNKTRHISNLILPNKIG